VFAGSHLICRMDQDSLPFEPEDFPDKALRKADAVVVSDYSKGGVFEEIADELVQHAQSLFVDAKHHWKWYESNRSFWFPNELEFEGAEYARETSDIMDIQIIQKRGAHGCKWNSCEFPATVSDVVDTTGAGDIFLAAFVYAYRVELLSPSDSLEFANILAGESCRHRGTYVVPREFAQSVLDRLLVSEESQQRVPENYSGSTSLGIGGPTPQNPLGVWTVTASACSLRADSSQVATDQGVMLNILDSWQVPRKLPSDPTDTPDVPTPERIDLEPNSKQPWEG